MGIAALRLAVTISRRLHRGVTKGVMMSNNTHMPIIRFKPQLIERVWGGRGLEEMFGRELPEGSHIGESWEISGLSDALTIVSDGPYAGADIYRLAKTHREKIFGSLNWQSKTDFPLLVKFIDAKQVLSLQVHPDDAYANNEGFACGKSEAWVIIRADAGAYVYRGFASGVTKNSFKEALSENAPTQDIIAMLNKVPVKAGDVIDLPAGMVHAIGEGLMLLEIQQSSDLTYRVYDWGRMGLDGNPRELHLDKAFDVMDFTPQQEGAKVGTPSPDGSVVYRDSYPFHLSVLALDAECELETPADRFEIFCVLEGEVEIHSNTEVTKMAAGSTALIPASLEGYTLSPTGNAKIARAWIM